MLEEKPDQKRQKILIVDDDILSLIILDKTLSGAGYAVSQATNGKDAIVMAEEEQPDLAILDIAMPDMDGINVAIILKNDLQTKNIPVIFISALGGEEIRKKISSLPGSSFLNKPLQKDDLLREVKKYL